MATGVQTFNGSDGGAIGALSGSLSGFSWDNAAAASALLSTGTKLSGTASCRITESAKQAQYRNGSYAGASTGIFYRQYIALPVSNPTQNFQLGYIANSAYSISSKVGITTDRRLFVITNAYDYNLGLESGTTNGTYVQSSAGVVPTFAWCRVEVTLTKTLVKVDLFTGTNIHGTTPDSTVTSGTVTDSISSIGVAYIGGVDSHDAAGTTRTFIPSGQYLFIDELSIDTASMPARLTAFDMSVTSSTTVDTTVTASKVTGGGTATVTSPTTVSTTVTADTVAPGSATVTLTTAVGTTVTASSVATGSATVTSSTATSTVIAAENPDAGYYPVQTRAHARAVNTDAPDDAVKGGPVVMGTLATELEAVSNDLVAARQEGAGFSTIRAAIAALWSALTGKADTSHTHSASNVTDFNTAVRTNRLDQLATPTASVAMGSQRITGLATPTVSTDAATKAYADSVGGGGSAGRQTAGTRIAFAGDSIMRFPGDTSSVLNNGRTLTACWPTILTVGMDQRALHVRNAAIGGDWSDNLVSRFATDVLSHAPHVVVIGIGTNDLTNVTLGTSGFSLAEWKANIATLVADTRAADAVPVLCTMPPINTSVGASYKAAVPKWNAWLRRYAASEGIAVIDVYAAVVDSSTGQWTTYYDSDGVHASEYGCTVIATAAEAVLSSIVPASAPTLALDGAAAENMLSGPLMLTDSSGTPTGWTAGGGALTVGTDTAFCRGRYVRLGSSRTCSQTKTTGFSAGDVIAVSGRVRTVSASPWTQEVSVSVTFTGSTGPVVIEPIADVYGDVTGTFYQEFTIPSGTTGITLSLNTGPGSGTNDFGQVGMFNLTVIGAV